MVLRTTRRLVGLSTGLAIACGGRVAELREEPEPEAGSGGWSASGGVSVSSGSGGRATSSGGAKDGAVGDPGGSGAVLIGSGSEGGGALVPEASGGAATSGVGGSEVCAGPGARFVTRVVEYAFGPGQSHNQEEGFPEALYGPPNAGDISSVVSLGNGGFVVLEFEGNTIVDGEGPDFVVFENPLPSFVELATVAVSDDLEHWYEFPCSAPQEGPDYDKCAGVQEVHASLRNDVEPLDVAAAGGDWFDLAEIGVARARYVRITDRDDLVGASGVFDLDAVGIRHAGCP